jgi:hypothetical protein
MFVVTIVTVISGMGLAGELALTDEAIALIIKAPEGATNIKKGFSCFFSI